MPPVSLGPASGRYLSFAEREEIAVLRAQGRGVRDIARELGRAPSTISRELRRNAATRGGRLDYRASVAQWHADRQARRPRVSKLAAHDRLREYVQDRLAGVIWFWAQGPARWARMSAAPDSVSQSVRVRRPGWMTRSASMSACQR